MLKAVAFQVGAIESPADAQNTYCSKLSPAFTPASPNSLPTVTSLENEMAPKRFQRLKLSTRQRHSGEYTFSCAQGMGVNRVAGKELCLGYFIGDTITMR